MAKGESGFDMLARLIKQEGEDIREEVCGLGKSLGKRIDRLEQKVDSGFAQVDQELSSIRAELKTHRMDIDELQMAVFKR